MRILPLTLPLVLAALAAQLPLRAADEAPAPAKRLTVLVKPAEPFAMLQDGAFTGYSVELWERVAQEAHLDFELKPASTAQAAIEAVGKGEADVAVGALSVTAERENIVDFTHPFYESGLQILVKGKNASALRAAMKAIFNSSTLKVVGLLLLALFAIAHVLWLSERRKNAETFPENYALGVFNTLWWSVSTLITGGCENLAPISLLGRLAGVVWMLGGIGLTAYITATLSAAMTVSRLTSDIKTLADLEHVEVGTVQGSSALDFLAEHQIKATAFENVDAARRAVSDGTVQAVVYDGPLLRYAIGKSDDTSLRLGTTVFKKEKYAFALPERSQLRKNVNEALLRVSEQGYLDVLEKKWFPKPESGDGD
jgi:polar amino acid transport system substrate-binding protein